MNQATELVSEARNAALSRIADVLSHPDDLFMKFPALRSKTIAERAVIEAQLKTALESQLDDAQLGLDTLAFCRTEADSVKQNLSSIQVLLNDAHHSIDNYAKIMQISKTHQNFAATKEMVKQFQALNHQIQRIKYFLDKDAKDLLGNHSNMLMNHYQIYQLETFKQLTMHQAKDATSDVTSTLESFFMKIDQLAYNFEIYFWSVAKNTLPLIKAGKASVIVRLVKIIENEERLDEEAAVAESMSQLKLSQSNLINDTSTLHFMKSRQVKSFRIKYFDTLRESIIQSFDDLYEEYNGDLTAFLSGVDVVIDDLILIYDELVPRFPRKYNIFQFFVLEYHRITYDVINRIVSDNIENASILSLLKWVQDYYSNMNGRLGVGEELLEPRLLDGKENHLIGQYVINVKEKLKDWLGKLLESELNDFVKRESAPEIDADSCYVMSGSVILFQMFNQQIDVVYSSSRGSLLNDVVNQCVCSIEEYQKAMLDVIESEYKKFDAKSPQLTLGLPEYIMAVANDCYRSTEFAETMMMRLEELLDEPYRGQSTTRLKDSSNGFIKVSKRAYSALIDIAIQDCRPALQHMFLHPIWYEQELTRLVIGTLEDYCQDFESHLTSHLFTKLTNDLIDRTIYCYLDCMRVKNAKFKMPFAGEKMKEELKMIITFFSRFKVKKRVKEAFEVIEKTINFIESNPRMAYMDFYNLWKMFPDMPYSFVEDLVYKRDDLEKGQAKEILESVKDKMKEAEAQQKETGSQSTTVFSKLYADKKK